MALTDEDILAWMDSVDAHPSVSTTHLRGVSYGRRRREQEDTSAIEAQYRPPHLEPVHFQRTLAERERDRERDRAPLPARSADELRLAEMYVKDSFAEKGILGTHHASTVQLRNGGVMWRMKGTCPIHGVPHGSNHWVLINSPGYNTTRIQCMKTLEIKEVHRMPLP